MKPKLLCKIESRYLTRIKEKNDSLMSNQAWSIEQI